MTPIIFYPQPNEELKDVDMPDNVARELYLYKLTLNKPVGKQIQVNRHFMKN